MMYSSKGRERTKNIELRIAKAEVITKEERTRSNIEEEKNTKDIANTMSSGLG